MPPQIERMFVRPAEGLQVRIPHTHALLPAAGDWVPRNPFWLRLLRDGDVVAAEPPHTAA